MKNKVRKIFIILLVSISLLSVNQIKKVKADSGWDSSYDSGGSWDSGSSYSSSSWDSSSSNDSNGEISKSFSIYIYVFTLILICIYGSAIVIDSKFNNKKTIIIISLLIILIWIICTFIFGLLIMSLVNLAVFVGEIISHIIIENIFSKPKKIKEMSKEKINEILPNIPIEKLKQELYDKFVKVQEAWMNFDYDNLRKLCNDNIYNTYYEELEALKLKDGQNIMSDFDKVEDKIIDVSNNKDIISIDYYLDVKFYDYVINTKTNNVEKGYDKIKIHNIYKLTFTKSNNENNTCPNCGAKIESGSTKCSHCKAVIVKDSSEFVLSEKRKIG